MPRASKFRTCWLFLFRVALAGASFCFGGAVSASPRSALQFSADPSAEEIFRAHVFEEPLVSIGEPTATETATLATALIQYSNRSAPGDFTSLEKFLAAHPRSSWNAALLLDLGLEYYNTAYYSRALEAWTRAWTLSKSATDPRGKALGDRAAGELAYMHARLGRMPELEALLKSIEGRVFVGSATERIEGARQGLWNMQHRPEISFRCGPLALYRISRTSVSSSNVDMTIFHSASTQKGFSLTQVAELSRKIGLNYQMAFRSAAGGKEDLGDFVVPSVVHWKLGHYAAVIRREADRYLLEDPTFGNTVWATRAALETEGSGYFLLPSGPLPNGWRVVDAKEGDTVWGKGFTGEKDEQMFACTDAQTGGAQSCGGEGVCPGMATSSVHLMLVNLQLRDQPVGYSPPVGPPVKFVVRYNQKDPFQPATFTYSNFGHKWTCDWISYITDDPSNPNADASCYLRGGGARTFTSFNTNSQTYAFEQYENSQLRRTGANSYEVTSKDGSKLLFSRPDGAVGTKRKIFLSQVIDPAGNAVTLEYDNNLRLFTISDALGQKTRLSYEDASDIYRITKVTDPFGRFARFEYDNLGRLTNITDVIGMKSQFFYAGSGDFINTLVTPYGTTTFIAGSAGVTSQWLETIYPDGSKDRVEFNQSTNLAMPFAEPAVTVPQGMGAFNQYLWFRNTYYWSRTACAMAYGDYSKAKVYHWLHKGSDMTKCSGVLESVKEPLERRVWLNYAGQSSAAFDGTSRHPSRVGRVLDDSTTQLSRYGYNAFGNLTNSVDPLGRTLTFDYDANGIDLLQIRMTRDGKNEQLLQAIYNGQHRPLLMVDAAGQTNTYTYNSRGQLLMSKNPKGETTTFTYDNKGYLLAVDGPLPGTNDTVSATYDDAGRMHTMTDVNGYTLTFDYDDMDRLTRVTYPDLTYNAYTYDRLDLAVVRDRAGRETFFEHDSMRQLRKRTDPLGRVTLASWCHCGAIKSLTDPMGRSTEWRSDVQSRPISKQYADGSAISYFYENASGRLREVIDERGQRTQITYNRDNTVRSWNYVNATVPTPSVSFTYDTDYQRVLSMTDGIGTTLYDYNPMTASPTLGAGRLASVDGPLPNDTISYRYDELGRVIHRTINGVDLAIAYDAAGRVTQATNALGSFAYAYDGSSRRVRTEFFPNGQVEELTYNGSLQDRTLQRIVHRLGAAPISEFIYGRDNSKGLITSWSQQIGAQPPDQFAFSYDGAGQLISATVTKAGMAVKQFTYNYDLAANRLNEQVNGTNHLATYNALNQLSTATGIGTSRTNEWDAEDRLRAISSGNQRTEFIYDGLGRRTAIRQLVNGSEVSLRRFVWCNRELCEERDASGAVTKRFFPQGLKVETGPSPGTFFYCRDHLGSIRDVVDAGGNVRARYAYDPFGRRTQLTGDVDANFGFAGMFWSPEVNLALAPFRAYDPEWGRWLSRDPLKEAEKKQGPNLYAYVGNEPVNRTDPDGLCAGTPCLCARQPGLCMAMAGAATVGGGAVANEAEVVVPAIENGAESCLAVVETLPTALPEIETAIPQLEATLPRIQSIGNTLPGVGPDTINVLAQTSPSLARAFPPLRDMALEARRVEAWIDSLADPASNFWQNWIDASREWREMGLSSKEAQQAVMWISRWAEVLF